MTTSGNVIASRAFSAGAYLCIKIFRQPVYKTIFNDTHEAIK